MSDNNSLQNCFVWVDIPVADLDRSIRFYSAVLAGKVTKQSMPGCDFAVLDHEHGNGGCLVVEKEHVSRDRGVLVYLNAMGRIRDAVKQAKANGGSVIEDVHSIGPHGFRAVIVDSEGNRIALHSPTDG